MRSRPPWPPAVGAEWIPPSFTPTAAANTPRPPASTSATGWGCANQWAAPAPGLDNAVAVAESFFATLKVELVDRCRYRTRAQARASVFRWIAWYNLHRLHSTNGYLPPLEWEQQHRHVHPLPSTLAA